VHVLEQAALSAAELAARNAAALTGGVRPVHRSTSCLRLGTWGQQPDEAAPSSAHRGPSPEAEVAPAGSSDPSAAVAHAAAAAEAEGDSRPEVQQAPLWPEIPLLQTMADYGTGGMPAAAAAAASAGPSTTSSEAEHRALLPLQQGADSGGGGGGAAAAAAAGALQEGTGGSAAGRGSHLIQLGGDGALPTVWEAAAEELSTGVTVEVGAQIAGSKWLSDYLLHHCAAEACHHDLITGHCSVQCAAEACHHDIITGHCSVQCVHCLVHFVHCSVQCVHCLVHFVHCSVQCVHCCESMSHDSQAWHAVASPYRPGSHQPKLSMMAFVRRQEMVAREMRRVYGARHVVCVQVARDEEPCSAALAAYQAAARQLEDLLDEYCRRLQEAEARQARQLAAQAADLAVAGAGADSAGPGGRPLRRGWLRAGRGGLGSSAGGGGGARGQSGKVHWPRERTVLVVGPTLGR
jgi:hypothetical protein